MAQLLVHLQNEDTALVESEMTPTDVDSLFAEVGGINLTETMHSIHGETFDWYDFDGDADLYDIPLSKLENKKFVESCI